MADEREYFVLCKDNCKFPAMTKEQVLAAIAEATGATVTDIDAAFISKIKEINKGATVQIWAGTTAEYNAVVAKGEKRSDVYYIKTDDSALADIESYFLQEIARVDAVIKSGLFFKRVLTAEDDLDQLFENGIYVYSTSSLPKNAPFENAAVVEVTGVDSTTTQKIQRAYRYGAAGYSAFRPLYSSKWQAWYYPLSTNNNALVADYVVEEGTEDGWNYRKWASGIAECWTTKSFATSIEIQIENTDCYRSDFVSYPFPAGLFKSVKNEHVSLRRTISNIQNAVYMSRTDDITAEQITFILYRIGASSAKTGFAASIEIKGTWK